MPFILDCSVTIAWCFEDEVSEYSEAVLDYLALHSAVVPAVWVYEVSNVLAVGERRARITSDQASRQIELLASLRITVADCDRLHLLHDLRELALRTGLAAYDAAYLDLALRTNLPLATTDTRLIAAAKEEQVPIFDPRSNL